MGVPSSGVAKSARAQAHAKHKHECPCGRVCWGNGWKSHARSCVTYLQKYGWPWDEGVASALRANLRETFADLPVVERSKRVHEAYRRECIQEARNRGLIPAGEVTP